MSNETKRDVLEKLAECYAEVYDAYTDETGSPYYCDDEPNYLDEYDNALPDDLPVIPKSVGEYIQWCKSYDGIHSISEALYYATESNREWIYRAKNSDAFALAWLLGVWKVKETGEIVKLEEEK
ncbi:DUF1642 domain-containing protein [Lacticaseibacillus zeae]|uniref:DUF1642 domain-containing protein n=1 Tax=Lacticaseibacillus zeae TaxID=57037 RepID=A0A5R8LHT4_LACZE|nr:DUF1642 domain-containing protein [Lacticaseibacillus zeae]TLF36670.1 DUF1642 domain-containing protein [Lacticaseibacillus zeae]